MDSFVTLHGKIDEKPFTGVFIVLTQHSSERFFVNFSMQSDETPETVPKLTISATCLHFHSNEYIPRRS